MDTRITPFVLIVNTGNLDHFASLINIAAKYHIDYTRVHGQIYLFIDNDDTLVNVVNAIHTEELFEDGEL